MKLHIKNMVCPRCIMAVDAVFKDLGYKNYHVSLGEVDLKEDNFPPTEKQVLKGKLEKIGFELIDDRKSQTIEAIKNLVIQKVHHEDLHSITINWSDLISDALHHEYKYLSRLFSSVEGITIEQFIIHQKIEKAKELIIYDQLTLSEISWKLGYSSVAHLSAQFKTITGMTPRNFKQMGTEMRKSLDEV